MQRKNLSERKQIECPFILKNIDENGTFEGYASIFGNIDLGYDVVERGAFKEIVTNENKEVVVLWQHDIKSPIGVATVKEDDVGLAFKGKLVLEDPNGRRAQAHMKAKSVRGMSIGYDVLPDGSKYTEGGVRLLSALKLWEISLVTFGMNPAAGVTSAKERVAQITSIRDYEDFLREVGGFSKSHAKILASGGWKALPGRRDADGEADELSTDAKSAVSFLESIAAGATK